MKAATSKRKQFEGQSFGRLVIVSRATPHGSRNSKWNVRCACGKEKIVALRHLTTGNTKSCGCLNAELNRTKALKHSGRNPQHIGTYRSWMAMNQRCANSKCKDFKNYGGRGISVCDEWVASFENFLADMGERPKVATIDRIDNNGPYAPWNCQWSSKKAQARNRRNNTLLTFGGATKPAAQWAEDVGLKYGALINRLRDGWSVESALTVATKPDRPALLITANGQTKTISGWAEFLGVNPCGIRERIKRGWSFDKTINTPIRAWSKDVLRAGLATTQA